MATYRIERGGGQPAYMQLYLELRQDITAQIYQYGDRLPSKRYLASETGTSVVTVQHTYDLLQEEGYIESRERNGYFVIYHEGDVLPVGNSGSEEERAVEADESGLDLVEERRDAMGGAAEALREDFPFSVFARTMRSVLTNRGEDILIRSPNSGCPELRRAIASYLERSRRISVDPEQIMIGSGSEYLYTMIAQMLGRDRVFALENPSYEKIRLVYEANGIVCDRLPMDAQGIKMSALRRSDATVLHVTPFNSFPSGITASASRRAEYIRWAQQGETAKKTETFRPEELSGRFIIEDDFDSEFTMSTKAENTLFSLEPERSVIYMNTFSRTIAPSMRIGYMVLPEKIARQLRAKIDFYSCTVPVFDQYVLAQFIDSGDFERHINRVRRHKRQAEKKREKKYRKTGRKKE